MPELINALDEALFKLQAVSNILTHISKCPNCESCTRLAGDTLINLELPVAAKEQASVNPLNTNLTP